ncbi:MAG: hypothetical protein JXR07_15855 [Reichenbachiella sp.]
MTDSLLKVTYAPLSPDERKKLKKGFYFIPFFTVFAGGIFYFMLSMAGGKDDFFFYAVLGMAAIFGLVIFWITRGIVLDLQDNEKKIVQGVVTHKESVRHKSKKGRSRTSYHLYFGEKSMRVEADLYHKFNEGDLIEIHQAKRVYNVIFKTEKLKIDVFPDKVSKYKTAHQVKRKRQGRYAIVGFLLFVPIFLTVLFSFFADCFYCPPQYPLSMTTWKVYAKDDQVTDSIEIQFERVLLMLNNGLTDQEEGELKEVYYDIMLDMKSDEFISYLANKRINATDTISALEWIQWKFDESLRIKFKMDVSELWNRLLYNIIPIEELKPSYLFRQNRHKYFELKKMVLMDENLTYWDVKNWFGAKSSLAKWQFDTKDCMSREYQYYSKGAKQFLNEVWVGDLQMEEQYQKEYINARKILGMY